MGSGPRRIRAFIALDPPDPVRARIAAWGARELSDPALRPTDEGRLHMTLCFLGQIQEPALARAEAIVRGVQPRAVSLALAAEPTARPRGRPRLFALDVASPEAVAFQAQLREQLVAERVYEPDERPFWPHLTLARVRTERGRRRPRQVHRRPGRLPSDLVRTFDSVRVALYRSNLRPTGAQYVSLATTDLPPTASSPGGEG